MRSRLLVGASVWLLGVAVATGGSMLAVSGLTRGPFGSGARQLTQTTVGSNLAGYQAHGGKRGSPRPSAATGDDNDDEETGSYGRPGVIAMPRSTPSRPSPGSGGSLLVSQGGSVMASCQSGRAYLQYWSPNQGYRSDDVFRGPALQASLVFESFRSALRVLVTCKGSRPVAHVSPDH
jgi:hypothetical protein